MNCPKLLPALFLTHAPIRRSSSIYVPSCYYLIFGEFVTRNNYFICQIFKICKRINTNNYFKCPHKLTLLSKFYRMLLQIKVSVETIHHNFLKYQCSF